ncbi:MAG: SPOR domain-containing protein [Candidatus Aphodousia sp.]|nr:SPOR domain-containing protein [Candidatus Aphodousia sp.]
MQEDKNTPRKTAFWKTSASTEEVSTEESLRMTADETQEQRQKNRFRHRVIGVVTLLATLGVFCPLIFYPPSFIIDNQAATDIPAIKKEPFYKLELPVNQPVPQAQAPGENALKDLTTPNVVGQAPEARHAPKDAEVESSQAKETSPSTQSQDTSAGGFFIQVMATSSEAGAMREMARYQAMGYPVYSVKVQKKAATLWRVRLGNFKTRAEADRAVQFLDNRKISHLPVQKAESAVGNVQRLTPPAQSLQGASQKAQAMKAPVAKSGETAKTTTRQTKSGVKYQTTKTSTASSAAKSAAKVTKTQEKTQTKAQTATKSTKNANSAASAQPAKSQKSTPAAKPKTSADPVADILRASNRDVIAEQIAKEKKKQ